MSKITLQTPSIHGNNCAHDYLIERVVMRHPRGGFVVLGSDDTFHVVAESCLQGKRPEVQVYVED